MYVDLNLDEIEEQISDVNDLLDNIQEQINYIFERLVSVEERNGEVK